MICRQVRLLPLPRMFTAILYTTSWEAELHFRLKQYTAGWVSLVRGDTVPQACDGIGSW